MSSAAAVDFEFPFDLGITEVAVVFLVESFFVLFDFDGVDLAKTVHGDGVRTR